MFMPFIPRNPGGKLLYGNKPDFMCGMNGINPMVYVDRTGGTWDFYRRGHDSSFGVQVREISQICVFPLSLH